MRMLFRGFMILSMLSLLGCGNTQASRDPSVSRTESVDTQKEVRKDSMDGNSKYELATFGNGCFWCSEAIFLRLKGVKSAFPGYSGGHVDNPTYEEVCTGTTGHAESIHITYNPAVTSYEELLEVFWKTHDPTTLNRQGNDVGTQYRSVIFYHNEKQKEMAKSYRAKLDAAGIWDRPIVTEIVAFKKFWPAEEYHQDYYARNPSNTYCRFVITPKIKKFEKIFKDRLK